MAKKEWEETLRMANEELKDKGAKLNVSEEDDAGYYALDIEWPDGSVEHYAHGYFENELSGLISDAWGDVKAQVGKLKTIYIVEVVIYDHYDNNLWSEVKAYTDEQQALSYFTEQSAHCYAEAQGQNEYDNPDEYYSVETVCDSHTKREFVRQSETPQHYKVEITEQKIAG